MLTYDCFLFFLNRHAVFSLPAGPEFHSGDILIELARAGRHSPQSNSCRRLQRNRGIFAPAPTVTLLPSVGCLFPFWVPTPPSVTPWYIVQLSPTTVVSPITTPHPWSINIPCPSWAPGCISIKVKILPSLRNQPGDKNIWCL